jgi:serine racemase
MTHNSPTFSIFRALSVVASTSILDSSLQVPDLDAIIVPVSGGGMMAGVAVAAKALKPSIRLIAAEPTGMSCA